MTRTLVKGCPLSSLVNTLYHEKALSTRFSRHGIRVNISTNRFLPLFKDAHKKNWSAIFFYVLYQDNERAMFDFCHLISWQALPWLGRVGRWPRPFIYELLFKRWSSAPRPFIQFFNSKFDDDSHALALGQALYPSSGGPGRRRRSLWARRLFLLLTYLTHL